MSERQSTVAFWPSSKVRWTEEGYRVSVDTPLTEHVLDAALPDVENRLTSLYGPAFVEVSASGAEHNKNGLVRKGKITFVVEDVRLFAADPDVVRLEIEEALRAATAIVAGFEAIERSQGREWLSALRRGGPPAR